MVLALDRDAARFVLAVDALEIAVEQFVDLGKRDLVLRALGPGEAGDDLGHVEFERVGEDRLVLGREPHALRLGIGFDQLDRAFVTAGQAHIFQRLLIDAEEAAGRAVFGRHIGDGGAIGEAQVGDARTVEFHEAADHAHFAQHLHAGQHEVGRGHAFGQRAFQLEADDFGDQHRDRLAEHGRFRLDPADAPAEHAQPVDHGGVAVGPDAGVGIGDGVALGIVRRPHALADIFQVHLVADAGARRHGGEVLEALRAPFEEIVPLRIAGVFEFHVLFHRLGMAEFVHHHRVVDHEIDRNLRIDLGGIPAELCNRIAHRGEIDHAGDAGEILQEDAGRTVLDFLAGDRVLLPIRDRLRIVGRDGEAAIFEPQHVFE